MRVLFAALGVPGFLVPMMSVARAVRSEGHAVAFVTDARAAHIVEDEGFCRIPCGESDGPSFQIESWGSELNIALQVKHLEYALERFPAQALCTSHLALGAWIVRERYGIPLGVMGSIVLLWDPGIHVEGTVTQAAWRHEEMKTALERARVLLGLPPRTDSRSSPLLADAFFLQGVPALQERSDELPPAIRFVGSCVGEHAIFRAPDERERAWFDRQRASGRRVVFVQLGRTFGRGDWVRRVDALLAGARVAYAIAKGRFEDDVTIHARRALVLDERVSAGAVMELVDAAIVTGQPSATLAAIEHGRPLIVVASGSGAEEIGEALQRYGNAVALDAEAGDEALSAAISSVLDDGALSRRARALAAAFAATGGPRAVAQILIELAKRQAPGDQDVYARALA